MIHARPHPEIFFFAIAILIVADAVFLWRIVSCMYAPSPPDLAFFDVGEGDAALVTLEGGVHILIDAGPGDAVLSALQDTVPGLSHIDLAIVSHPSAEHFAGLAGVIARYGVGAFVYAGRNAPATDAGWPLLLHELAAAQVPLVTLGEDDHIIYRASQIDILAPDPLFAASASLDQADLVAKFRTPDWTALFTADIDAAAARALVHRYGAKGLRADVLKVAAHGTDVSSPEEFLRAVAPRIAVIEKGPKNAASGPTRSLLVRFASSSSTQLFRTDQDGTVRISVRNGTATER